MARNGLFEVKFRVDGETKRRSAYGKTKKEAETKAIQMKALIEAGLDEKKASSETVKSWSERWLETYKSASVSPFWYKQMESIIRIVIVPSIGQKRLSDVRPIDVQNIVINLGRSASYEAHTITILKQIFESAVDNDIIKKNPCKNLKRTKSAPKGERRPITEEERRYTMQTASRFPEDGVFILFMLLCGLRPQESAVMTWGDIDFQGNRVHVCKALKKDGTVGATKSTAGVRLVPLPGRLKEHLLKMKRGKDSDYIVTNTRGGRLTYTSMRGLWKRFKRNMELQAGAELFRNQLVSTKFDELTPYFYRHTYCTDLQDAGVPIVVASRIMGHADIHVTAKIYMHHSPISFEDSAAKVNALQDKIYAEL